MATRQRAVAMYLIDRFALRAGNEKGEDEADTVGCCSLRFEHVTLTPPNKVTFDFLGKDSIRYVNEVEVDEQVFKNLKLFKKEPKTVGDLLFDRLSVRPASLLSFSSPSPAGRETDSSFGSCAQTSVVNKYLTSYMDGLTAKVFRTYNASWTFAQQLKNTPKDASVADKLLAYNRANRLVAVLCNHQRSVSKGHSAAMEKLVDKVRRLSLSLSLWLLVCRADPGPPSSSPPRLARSQIRALKYQRMKLRKQLFAVADKPKKYKEPYGDDESDLEDDWIKEHEVALVVAEREKIRKKFDRDNTKREADGEKKLPQKDLDERLKAADDLEKTIKRERKQGYKEGKLSEDRLVTALVKIDERIQVAKTAATDRDEGKGACSLSLSLSFADMGGRASCRRARR